MLAYHNDPAIKAAIIAELERHRAEDRLVKGQYWENGKGCAVGCAIHCGDHARYEGIFGIPRILARLEDCLFEGLPNALAMEWPARFMGAIHVGAELSMVWPRFALWLLKDEVAPRAKTDRARNAVDRVSSLYREWRACEAKPSRARWEEARADAADAHAAASAYAITTTAAAYADAAAAAAAHAYAAAAAAHADAHATAHAITTAADAAAAATATAITTTAAAAAAAAVHAYAAAAAAHAITTTADAAILGSRSACYTRMANKLVHIIADTRPAADAA
jgi:hypothetical protein